MSEEFSVELEASSDYSVNPNPVGFFFTLDPDPG
jgi:hypothetical protein